MKLIHTLITFSLFLFILSGCASTNTNRAEETVSSMDDVEEKLNEISEQLSQTESSLQDISNANSENIEDAFNTFRDNVSEVDDLREDLSEMVKELNNESEEYISQWQAEAETYQSENLRSGSADRRQEVREAFNTIMDRNGDLTRSLNSYLSAAREIESYLENDTTTQGVEAVYSLTQQVEDTGDDARQAINSMQRAINNAKDQMGAQTQQDN